MRLPPVRPRAQALLLTLALPSGCVAQDLAGLERTLSSQQSATAALEQWCSAKHIAEPAKVVADADRSARMPASADVRAALAVAAGPALGYRHVALRCGGRVLSVAHNWYVPERLTPEMNHTLETSDVPFGKVVAPLQFRRERLARVRGRAAECPAGTVLSDRALLRKPDGQAISLVIECYTRANLRP